MQKSGRTSQVKSGLRLAGLTLVFLGIAGLFLAGMSYAFFPASHSRALGLLFLIISVPAMVVTMNRWAKVLAGLLALAVLNGVISISTGHLLANPNQPMSRQDALYITVFFAVAATLASTLKGRKLNLVDRIAVLGFVSSLALLMEYEGTHFGPGAPLGRTDFTLMGICLCCLLIDWRYGRLQRRCGHNLRGHHVEGQAGRAGSADIDF